MQNQVNPERWLHCNHLNKNGFSEDQGNRHCLLIPPSTLLTPIYSAILSSFEFLTQQCGAQISRTCITWALSRTTDLWTGGRARDQLWLVHGWFWALLPLQDFCPLTSSPSPPSRSVLLAWPSFWNILPEEFQITGLFLLSVSSKWAFFTLSYLRKSHQYFIYSLPCLPVNSQLHDL